MERMMYVEYGRDPKSRNRVTDCEVMSESDFNKLKTLGWVNVFESFVLSSDEELKDARDGEHSVYEGSVLASIPDYPIAPSGVGSGTRTRWVYAQYGNLLSAYSIGSRVDIIFNLNSASDVDNKLNHLYAMRERGLISNDDISELEERLRTLSSIQVGGNADQSKAGISEGIKRKKGQKYYTYEDGVKKEHIARGSHGVSSDAQKKAAENARKYAHTESADKKRRKSISARGDGKILNEI